MRTTNVAAVIVSYNRLEKLKQCVSALANSLVKADILVVDNASTDGTSEWLSSQGDVLECRNTGHNIGGAGGFNYGVKWAVELGYEYIWLMDDDCFVNPDSLSELLKADSLLDGNYGWLSSVALWGDGMPCLMNRQKLSPDFYDDAHLLQHALVRASQATFVSLLLRRSVVKECGLPIADFFIWGDDVEYTRRISVRHGKPSYIVGRSIVSHAMASNNGSSIATDCIERVPRYAYAYRNEAYLYRKEGLRGIGYFFAKCVYNSFRIIRSAESFRMRRLWVLIANAFRGLFFNPKVEFVS